MAKKTYEAPEIRTHGDIRDITLGSRTRPTFYDATFPAGTPFSALTFVS